MFSCSAFSVAVLPFSTKYKKRMSKYVKTSGHSLKVLTPFFPKKNLPSCSIQVKEMSIIHTDHVHNYKYAWGT